MNEWISKHGFNPSEFRLKCHKPDVSQVNIQRKYDKMHSSLNENK